ncbi:MAG TPA: YraN family protein [Intrasporangium sp.]|uniref:YraN family protein n=1 Tax=Intrasporangium sp. TaxID=1925024 RepID=UPI002D776B58|nr:YraN family protein [Intrasporangium sp.]HET7399278.1 YraN family protein [Intrasporangium sp.]
MDSLPSRILGDYGERLACRYLTDRGLTVLDRNWRCARGEIDIVAEDGGCIVICEVKTRSSEQFGAPFEAVTQRKVRRLRRLAGLWLETGRSPAEGTGRSVAPGGLRIDVISILCAPGAPARLEHLRGVS